MNETRRTEDILFICSCSHHDHELIASMPVNPLDRDDPELYLSVRLEQRTLWGRIKQCWRHLRGEACGFITMSEFIVRTGDIERLRELLDDYEALVLEVRAARKRAAQ